MLTLFPDTYPFAWIFHDLVFSGIQFVSLAMCFCRYQAILSISLFRCFSFFYGFGGCILAVDDFAFSYLNCMKSWIVCVRGSHIWWTDWQYCLSGLLLNLLNQLSITHSSMELGLLLKKLFWNQKFFLTSTFKIIINCCFVVSFNAFPFIAAFFSRKKHTIFAQSVC